MWYRPLSFPTKKGKEKTCTYDLCIKKIKCKKWFHWWFLSPFCKNVLFMFDSHSWDNVKSYFCHNKNLNKHFQSCLLIIYHYHSSLGWSNNTEYSSNCTLTCNNMLKLLSARWQCERNCLPGLHMITDVLFLLQFLKIWVYLHLINQ